MRTERTWTERPKGRDPGECITEPQPGNNFIAAVHPRDNVLRHGYQFSLDGTTLYLMHEGQRLDVPDRCQTPLLTVWRTLWVELDDMVAPDPDIHGPFAAAGVDEDDVYLDPSLPPIGLPQSSLQWALVEVKPLPAAYNIKDLVPDDETGTVPFIHNLEMDDQNGIDSLHQVRDVLSERHFWVVHVIGAYEGPKVLDYDDEPNFRLGYAYGEGGDRPIGIFFEVIRDVAANYPGGTVDEQVIRERIVLHEVLHQFFGPHGAPGADEGVMYVPIVLNGTPEQNLLTPRQIRLIGEKNYPGGA